MKKNWRVVQITGFRGLFFTIFIISCLISGFIAFPAFVSMNIWNYFSTKIGSFPQINFWQGVLLWAIVVFSMFVFSKRKFIVSFNAKQELNDDEVKEVISKIKSQAFNHGILSPKDDSNANEQKDDLKELSSEQKEN